MNFTCEECGLSIDPDEPSTYRRVIGWERKLKVRASGAPGGSDITLRRPLNEFAHFHCIEKLKAGVHVHQETLV